MYINVNINAEEHIVRINNIVLSKERNVTLTTYLIEDNEELHHGLKRPMIIICPGGGYFMLSKREAEPIALAYLAAGFHTAVLYYGIGEHAVMPGPVKDIASAVATVRNNANEWFIDTDNIYVSGFSAGGHVAASLGVFWNNSHILPEYADNPELIKPNGLILGYPVINLKQTNTKLDIGIVKDTNIEDIDYNAIHPNIKREDIFIMDEETGRYMLNFEMTMNAYIFGGYYTDSDEDYYSLQNHVSTDTPKTFIWHTVGDDLIRPANSLDFMEALRGSKVPFEAHIFSEGGHGTALANYITSVNSWELVKAQQPWMELSIAWLLRETKLDTKLG